MELTTTTVVLIEVLVKFVPKQTEGREEILVRSHFESSVKFTKDLSFQLLLGYSKKKKLAGGERMPVEGLGVDRREAEVSETEVYRQR